MPAYNYRAVHASGKVARGRIAAANESELAQHLGQAGLELISARAKTETPHRVHMPRRIPPRALTVFSAQMADLLNAGVAFIDGLRDIAEATEPGTMRDTLTDIARAISHGSRIGEAFARFPRVFSPVYVSILTAGEASGDLASTFRRLARYAESRAKTAEQMRRALRYPLFMLTVALGAVTFMMSFVVPQIIAFLNSIDSELPLSTRILVAASDMFAAGWWIFALAIIGGVASVSILRRSSESAARIIDDGILRLPLLGAALRKIALARFMQNFALLFESDVGILAALRGAKPTLGNRALESAVDNAEKQILAGTPLSAAMEGILPMFARRMIRVGEQSGALGKSLNDIASTQEREVNEMTERMIGSLEPALTLLIGALLAWIVLAVLGPIYGNLGKLGAMG